MKRYVIVERPPKPGARKAFYSENELEQAIDHLEEARQSSPRAVLVEVVTDDRTGEVVAQNDLAIRTVPASELPRRPEAPETSRQ